MTVNTVSQFFMNVCALCQIIRCVCGTSRPMFVLQCLAELMAIGTKFLAESVFYEFLHYLY